MSNILVVGGAGYIGSHACKALAAAGHRPIVYDNLSRGHDWAVKWGPLLVGDISNIAAVRAAIDAYNPQAIMHFAAYAYVGESMETPISYYENNFSGTLALLRVAVERHLPIVFSSTCATYGVPHYLPIDEAHPQVPINPYGRSKLFVEHLLRDIDAAHHLPWVALRYFNAAGADPDGAIGEMHDPEPHLVPATLNAASSGRAIKIFGTDYDTPDGTCVRDFVHVVDIAEAHVRALKYLFDSGASIPLNLANARGYSVKEVIAGAERVTSLSIKVETAPRRLGDPAVLVGDASEAAKRLGWQPRRSDLRTQIEDAWRWNRALARTSVLDDDGEINNTESLASAAVR
jgi:UDP-arabinose 4-epimerase